MDWILLHSNLNCRFVFCHRLNSVNENMIIQNVCQFLETFAPLRLAEDWDNVGLIAGDRQRELKNVMTCLTITPETADEAVAKEVDLIVSHHPLPFRPVKKLTTDVVPSALLWKLAGAGVSVYSPHTAFDSAAAGINQMIANKVGIDNAKPLAPIVGDEAGLGAGRYGRLGGTETLDDFIKGLKKEFNLDQLQCVAAGEDKVSKVAIACGSGGSFLAKAAHLGCDTMITGEATFHTSLEAKAKGVSLVLLGHYSSERFAVEALAERLQQEFSELKVWASADECDPIEFV